MARPSPRRGSGKDDARGRGAAGDRAGKIEDEGYEDRSLAYQQMVRLVLGAQREALLRMRSDRKLSNEVMNRILHELDLEESRLEI
jgi:CPA1 family monovalent cation:H+ antiporter